MTDVSRVVLVTPQRTVEIALPSGVPLADLMPVLVQRTTAAGVPDSAGRHKAFNGETDWVLQRLGSGPLDEELTPSALQVRDGETLYLRQREAPLPPVHFDDLIDGLATGLRDRPDGWHAGLTRVMFLVSCAVTLLATFLVLLDGSVPRRGALAAGCAVALAFGAMMCSRALADGAAAITIGVAAVPFAGMAGFAAIPAPVNGVAMTPQLLCAAVAASVCALLVTFAVGHHRPFFLAAWLVSLAVAAGVLLVVIGLSIAQAVAAVVALSLLATGAAPSVAFRLALMRLPQLPTSGADLSDDIEPFPSQSVISGAVVADGYLTWLLVASGAICTAGLAVLAPMEGWAVRWFVIAAFGVLIIRSRGLSSGWQRLSTLAPVLIAGTILTVRSAGRTDAFSATITVLALLGLAVLMLALSRSMPGRRPLPHWGRVADFAEYLFAVALVLLLFAVFDAYQWARSLAG